MDQNPRVQTAAVNILSQALAEATLGPLTRTALQVLLPHRWAAPFTLYPLGLTKGVTDSEAIRTQPECGMLFQEQPLAVT
jgi:hypothetical protein